MSLPKKDAIGLLLVDLADIAVDLPADIQRHVVPDGVHLTADGVAMLAGWLDEFYGEYFNEFDRIVVDGCMTPYRQGGRREQRDWGAGRPEKLGFTPVCHCPGGSFTRGWYMEDCHWQATYPARSDLFVTAGNDLWHGSSAASVSAHANAALRNGALVMFINGFQRGAPDGDSST